MKFLKCVNSSSVTGIFTVGEVYPVQSFSQLGGYLIKDNKGRSAPVPLNGLVWEFECIDVDVNQMYFKLHKNEKVFAELIQEALNVGLDEWDSVEHYMALCDSEYQAQHTIFFEEGGGINGIDSGNVFGQKPEDLELYEVSGEVFLEAFKEHFKSITKEPKPRYHRKRKPVPKRTITTAKIYYVDGSTYTVKHVDKVVCYGGKVSLFGRQDVTEGIEDSHLVKIEAGLIRNIVIKSPSQVTQIERDFVQGDKWNVHRKKEQIFRAAQIDIEV